MKKAGKIITILLFTLLAIGLLMLALLGNHEEGVHIYRETGQYDSNKLQAIAHSFTTKSWKHEEKTKSEAQHPAGYSGAQDSKNSNVANSYLSDPKKGQLLDDQIAAIAIAGIEEDQSVISVLAATVFISTNEFTIYYNKALTVSSQQQMASFFPNDGLAIEIYNRVDDIKALISRINT